MYFSVNKGTYTIRFYTKSNRIVIYDICDNIFYLRELPTNFDGVLKINFPAPGVYYCDDYLDILDCEPLITADDIVLPAFEHNYSKPLDVISDPQTNGIAQIYPHAYDDLAVVVVGKGFHDCPQPFRLYYLLHEMGHLYYDTEWKCDLFALKYMKQLGYNESNMLYAMTKMLNLSSPENQDRIHRIFKTIAYGQ